MEELTPVSYSDESQLQKMLYDSPELIPIPNDEAVAVFIREAGCRAPDDAVQEFRKVVAQFKAFDQLKVMNSSQPMAKLAELSSDEINKFVQAGQNVVNKWRAAIVNLSIATGASS